MKCLLLNSPIYRDRSDAIEDYLPPLGLGYIATHLNDSGINAEIIDCVKERYGVNEIFDLLSRQMPEFIGINIFTQNYDTVKEIIENCPISATIIIGGQVVKFIYNEILGWSVQNSLIIVIGEGELLLPAIINGNFVEAPIFEDENKRVFKVDMNSSYFPGDLSGVHLNRSVLKDDVVINHYGEKETSIITSRGCMYNCAFCGGAHNLNKDATIRYRTTADVTKEIADILSANTDITSIRILDDLFLRNKKSISNAVQIFEQFPTLSWRGMAHVLTFIESIEALPRLRESGCRELFLGIESGSERIRKKINKPGTISQIEKVVYALLHTGIDVKGYFMFGFPTNSFADTFTMDPVKSLLDAVP